MREIITHGFQDPADGTVPTAANNPKVFNVLEQLQTLQWSALRQIVNLSRVEYILELPQNPSPLTAARFGINEHDQRLCSFRRVYLE